MLVLARLRGAARHTPPVTPVGASAALLAGYVAIVVFQHVLQPELSPRQYGISAYATGSPGWLMTVGFLAWAGAFAAQAVAAVRSRLGPRMLASAVSALLGVAALGAVGTALWRTSARHGDASGLLELAVWFAAVASLGLSDTRLRAAVAMLLPAALAGAVLLGDDPGLRQRWLIAAGCAWQALHLVALRRRGVPRLSPGLRKAPRGGRAPRAERAFRSPRRPRRD